MNLDAKIIDLMFRQISPEKVLEVISKELDRSLESFLEDRSIYHSYSEKLFMYFAEASLQGYSEDEQGLVYKQIGQWIEEWNEKPSNGRCDYLIPLITIAQKHLELNNSVPVCKYGNTIEWRDLYLRIGQDPFICAFLAYRDHIYGTNRTDFTWPIIIRVNNDELYRMLDKGMAENHNHLNGSTQSFQITWCRMMNYPDRIREELIHFRDMNYYYKIVRGSKTKALDVFDMLELAAIIRSVLFRAIHRDFFSGIEEGTEFNSKEAFIHEHLMAFSSINKLIDTVDCLRNNYGVKIQTLTQPDYCLDYALEDCYLRGHVNSGLRIVVGERAFLYRCMRECLNPDGFTGFEKKLFYLYLVLQCNFRSEMIQNNGQVGFKNFQNYQSRKADSWFATPYFGEAVRMALNSRLSSESIVSLEGRLVPSANIDDNIDNIYLIDITKKYIDCPEDQLWNNENYLFNRELDWESLKEQEYFFVYHFIKSLDKRRSNAKAFRLPVCRHQEKRRIVKEQAIGFGEALKKSPYLRCRVRGIDAASNEFMCRPEVFAVAYRYLEMIQDNWNAEFDRLLPSSPIKINKSYHAGEDFLDIISGLRAIDESIKFLNMKNGSRIGHALAMGVKPKVHFTTKHYEIVTTKQERLDDLVWLLMRSSEMDVKIDAVLKGRLQQEAEYLLRYIYSEVNKENVVTLLDYWASMKLRGDDPEVYSSGRFIEPRYDVNSMTLCLLDADNSLQVYRKNDLIAGLCYYYQYHADVAKRGDETLTVKVSKDYVRLCKQMQDAMIQVVYDNGIVIECNPSSNVLIGTFKDYHIHPIFRFNDRKLNSNKSNDKVHLRVCVNTDDIGVFDTSLEFEYALLYQALLDKGKYSSRDIMEYLDDLREMGVNSTFPRNC